MKNRSWSQTGRSSATGILYSHFFGQVRMYREKIVVACDELQRVHPAFNTGRDTYRSHCDFAISSLSCLKEPVQALRVLFRNSPVFPVNSEHYYSLTLSLCQASEQGQHLHALITAYRHDCQTYSPRLIYQKLEIYDALGQLMKCSKETLSQIEHFMDETRFPAQKRLPSNNAGQPAFHSCEADRFTSANADPQYDNVIFPQQYWPHSSHHSSHYPQQARKARICSYPPAQKDDV